MKIIWKYLKPFKGLLFLSMGLAAIAQVLELIDPIIFGKIIDLYAVNTDGRTESELIRGALRLLALAVGVALLARLARAFKDFVTRLTVQKFGLSVFDEGLRHTHGFPTMSLKRQAAGMCFLFSRK